MSHVRVKVKQSQYNYLKTCIGLRMYKEMARLVIEEKISQINLKSLQKMMRY